MVRQYSVVCEDDVTERVRSLAREYDLTEEEVLRQLIQRGLEQTDPGQQQGRQQR
jgi:predicted transcriptional regulator